MASPGPDPGPSQWTHRLRPPVGELVPGPGNHTTPRHLWDAQLGPNLDARPRARSPGAGTRSRQWCSASGRKTRRWHK